MANITVSSIIHSLLQAADAAAARVVLALGNSSTKDTGTTAGTVAAGDHSHSGVYKPVFAVAAITYASSITTDASTVPHDDVRTVTLTGALTLGAPTNPANGQRFSYHLTASGGTRTVTLNASIKTPTGVTFDGAIPSGSTRVLELTYLGSRWLVTRNLEAVA